MSGQMCVARKPMELGNYLVLCVSTLIPVYLTAYAFGLMKGSPSILVTYRGTCCLFQAVLLLAVLALSRTILHQMNGWQTCLLGGLASILTACVAIPLATVFSLPDGLERVANSYRFAGIFQAGAASILFTLYSGVWLRVLLPLHGQGI